MVGIAEAIFFGSSSCVYSVLARSLQPSPRFRHSKAVIPPPNLRRPTARDGFSLVEMVAVIAVVVILLIAGVNLIGNTSAQARKAASDQIAGLIEQARTTAIASRATVVLAIAEPGDLPATDERCRLGLFRVEGEWNPETATGPVSATLLSRWKPLETGVVLLGADQAAGADTLINPLSAAELTVSYKTNKTYSVKIHALAFNSRGGLLYPTGSTPANLRIAEGGYRGGKASPNKRGNTVAENLLRIGRVTARPYRIDG